MNYYLVSQRQTHKYEFKHKLLWSPKRKKASKYQSKGTLYKNMANVKKGDIIFHGYENAIHAVSVATSNSYSCPKPEALSKMKWNKSGFRVDLKMIPISNIPLIKYKQYLCRIDYKGFDKNGSIPQIYLSRLFYNSSHLLMKILPKSIIDQIKSIEEVLKSSSKNISTPISFHHMNSHDLNIHRNKSNNHKSHKQYKGHSIKQHININIHKFNNGVLGEYYTCLDLQNRFKSPKYTIIGKSRNFSDKLSLYFKNIKSNLDEYYGCDYVVINNDNNHRILIDSKATTAGPKTPFYMSEGEKSKWNIASKSHGKKIYEIYRIYYLRRNDRNGMYFDSNTQNNGMTSNNSKHTVFIPRTVYEVKPYKIPR